MRTRVASTAYDELDEGGALKRLYQYDAFVQFVGAVTSQPRLYRLADPLGACSINVFRPGWHHAWHFDESEFTTTLSLQQAERGGEFEFTPPLRRSQAELAEPAVARILNERSPYTLQIFAGRYSLHHVKRVADDATRERLVAVMCFATEPGKVNSAAVQQMFWGRSVEA